MLTAVEIGAVIAIALLGGSAYVRWLNERTFWATMRAISEAEKRYVKAERRA